MKTKSSIYTLYAAVLVALVGTVVAGCGNNDNRTPTAEEINAAKGPRLKYVDSLNMPEAAKKETEAEMGGPPYHNPAIAEAMARAKAGGAKIGEKTRTQ